MAKRKKSNISILPAPTPAATVSTPVNEVDATAATSLTLPVSDNDALALLFRDIIHAQTAYRAAYFEIVAARHIDISVWQMKDEGQGRVSFTKKVAEAAE